MSFGIAIALISRGVLAGVFGVSAVAKFRDRTATRAALRASGLPENMDRSLAIIEGFTAFGLVMERHTAWSAFVACTLLTAFTVFVIVQLHSGNRAPCACFGNAAMSRPTDGLTVARNLALVAMAVLATGSTGRDQWLVWAVAAVVAGVMNAVSAAGARAAR